MFVCCFLAKSLGTGQEKDMQYIYRDDTEPMNVRSVEERNFAMRLSRT